MLAIIACLGNNHTGAGYKVSQSDLDLKKHQWLQSGKGWRKKWNSHPSGGAVLKMAEVPAAKIVG